MTRFTCLFQLHELTFWVFVLKWLRLGEQLILTSSRVSLVWTFTQATLQKAAAAAFVSSNVCSSHTGKQTLLDVTAS